MMLEKGYENNLLISILFLHPKLGADSYVLMSGKHLTDSTLKDYIMKTFIRTALCASILFSTASMAAMMSDNTTMVGGAAMYPYKKYR